MTGASGRNYTIPNDFQLAEVEYECADCGKRFVCRTSPDNVLVKFIDDKNSNVRWLPTFEKGGYLDAVEQCVPGFHRDQEITMKVFREFEKKFRAYQHRPVAGGYWSVAVGCRCPNCGGRNNVVLGERVVSNPQVEWLTYDPIT